MVGHNANQSHYEDGEDEPQPGVASRVAMILRKKGIALAEIALGSGFSLTGVLTAPGLFMIVDGASRVLYDRGIIEQFKGGHIQRPIGRFLDKIDPPKPKNNGHH